MHISALRCNHYQTYYTITVNKIKNALLLISQHIVRTAHAASIEDMNMAQLPITCLTLTASEVQTTELSNYHNITTWISISSSIKNQLVFIHHCNIMRIQLMGQDDIKTTSFVSILHWDSATFVTTEQVGLDIAFISTSACWDMTQTDMHAAKQKWRLK